MWPMASAHNIRRVGRGLRVRCPRVRPIIVSSSSSAGGEYNRIPPVAHACRVPPRSRCDDYINKSHTKIGYHFSGGCEGWPDVMSMQCVPPMVYFYIYIESGKSVTDVPRCGCERRFGGCGVGPHR